MFVITFCITIAALVVRGDGGCAGGGADGAGASRTGAGAGAMTGDDAGAGMSWTGGGVGAGDGVGTDAGGVTEAPLVSGTYLLENENARCCTGYSESMTSK